MFTNRELKGKALVFGGHAGSVGDLLEVLSKQGGQRMTTDLTDFERQVELEFF